MSSSGCQVRSANIEKFRLQNSVTANCQPPSGWLLTDILPCQKIFLYLISKVVCRKNISVLTLLGTKFDPKLIEGKAGNLTVGTYNLHRTYPDAGPEDGYERQAAGLLQTRHWFWSLFRGGAAHPVRLSSLPDYSLITPPPPLDWLVSSSPPPSRHLCKAGRFYRGPHGAPLSGRLIEKLRLHTAFTAFTAS